MRKLTIEECQQVELDIMKAIHSFCCERNLRYLLAYGTLIGAVRHKGFIPWDNDMDIVMPRSDYEQLISALKDRPIAGHLYLLHYSSDSKYHYQCARICDSRTEVRPPYIREQPKRMGVWVDVFPIDGIPDNPVLKSIASVRMGVLKVLQRSDIYAVEGVKGWKHSLKRALRKAFPNKGNAYQRKLDIIACKTGFGATDRAGNITEFEKTYAGYVPADFDSPMLLDFEGQRFFAPRRYDEILTSEYGEYMELPPLEGRTTHDLDARWIAPEAESVAE